MVRFLLILIGGMLPVSAASAEQMTRLFDARVDYRVVVSPYDVCVHDFDNDGNLDIATGSEASDSISILLGDGAGSFSQTANYYACYEPEALVASDVDGNGAPDLVTVSGNYQLCWMHGNNTGAFAPGTVIDTGVQYFCVGQFNSDNYPDLVVTHSQWDFDSVSVYLNNGDGTFAPAVHYWFGMNSRTPIVADFDGDGAMDFAVPRYMDTISVYYGNGDGSFAQAYVIETGTRHEQIVGGDCNGDGYDDLIVAAQMDRGVSIYLSDGAGNLTFDSLYFHDTWPDFITTGDINGDGALDIAYVDDTLYYMMGLGDGTFGPPQIRYAGPRPKRLCLADINDDRGMDAIVTGDAYDGYTDPGHVSVLQGTGDGDFHLAPHMFVREQVKALATCDVDGDSDLDLLTATWWVGLNDTLSVFLNDGTGNFTLDNEFGLPQRPWNIVPAELNGDADLDLIVTFSLNNQLMLRSGGAGGTFGVISLPVVGDRSYNAFAGDLDTNGTVDIATVSATDGTMLLLLNDGAGTFTPQAPMAVGVGPRDIDGGDLDGDGDLDLVVASASLDQVEVYLNDGTAMFTFDTAYYTAEWPEHVRLFDLDNDSDLDMVSTAWYGDTLSIFENDGSGRFSVAGTFRMFAEPSYIEALDLDNDGLKDIAVTSYSDNNISLLFNMGSMAFQQMIGAFGVGDYPEDMVSGDFDGDGSPDLAVTNYGHGTISILTNRWDIVTDVGGPDAPLPTTFHLKQNYPNPFNPTTTISYSLPVQAEVTVTIYDILGRTVRVFDEELQSAGEHELQWDGRTDNGRAVATGVYFYRLTAGDVTESRKMILLK